MSSFYGNSGPLNYDYLENTPIENQHGTEEEPVVLSDLPQGEYIVEGQYKYDGSDVVVKETEFLHVYIGIDEYSGRKTCYYETIEGGEHDTYNITFYDEYPCTIDKHELVDTVYYVDELPAVGREDILYVTKDNNSIYRWVDNEFIEISCVKAVENTIWQPGF